MKLKGKILIATLLISLLMVGCTSQETEKPEDNDVNQEEDVDKDDETQEDTEKEEDETEEDKPAEELITTEDEKSIKEEVEKEEAINSAIVTSMESGGKAYILIDIEIATATEEQAENLANKYADKYKEEYPDNVVDVKVMKDGETLVQETRE